MRLTLAKLPGRDGAARIGLVHETFVLDAHEAHATALSLHLDSKRAFELADALVPPDLYGFVRNGRHAWRALALALEYLGETATDPELLSPRGDRVVFRHWEVDPLPMLDGFTPSTSDAAAPEAVVYGRGSDTVTRTCYHTGAEYAVELAAVIAKPGAGIDDLEAWDHIAGYLRMPAAGGTVLVLNSPDQLDVDDQAEVYCELADAVSTISRQHVLETGDIVRAGTGRREVVRQPTIDLTDPYLLEVLLNSSS